MDIKQVLRGSHNPTVPHARLGIVGTVLLAALLILSLSSGPLLAVLTGRSYIAEFAEAGAYRRATRSSSRVCRWGRSAR